MQIEPEIAGDDARNIEQIVYQPRLRTCVALDRFDRARGVRSFDFAITDHRSPAENRGQRRAQLVRERGEEFILQSVRLFSVSACITLAQQRCRAFFFRALAGGNVEHQREH